MTAPSRGSSSEISSQIWDFSIDSSRLHCLFPTKTLYRPTRKLVFLFHANPRHSSALSMGMRRGTGALHCMIVLLIRIPLRFRGHSNRKGFPRRACRTAVQLKRNTRHSLTPASSSSKALRAILHCRHCSLLKGILWGRRCPSIDRHSTNCRRLDFQGFFDPDPLGQQRPQVFLTIRQHATDSSEKGMTQLSPEQRGLRSLPRAESFPSHSVIVGYWS